MQCIKKMRPNNRKHYLFSLKLNDKIVIFDSLSHASLTTYKDVVVMYKVVIKPVLPLRHGTV